MFFLLLLHRFNREVFNACVLAIGVHITCIMYVCKYQQNQQTDLCNRRVSVRHQHFVDLERRKYGILRSDFSINSSFILFTCA